MRTVQVEYVAPKDTIQRDSKMRTAQVEYVSPQDVIQRDSEKMRTVQVEYVALQSQKTEGDLKGQQFKSNTLHPNHGKYIVRICPCPCRLDII
jgi:hypothetical protein